MPWCASVNVPSGVTTLPTCGCTICRIPVKILADFLARFTLSCLRLLLCILLRNNIPPAPFSQLPASALLSSPTKYYDTQKRPPTRRPLLWLAKSAASVRDWPKPYSAPLITISPSFMMTSMLSGVRSWMLEATSPLTTRRSASLPFSSEPNSSSW